MAEMSGWRNQMADWNRKAEQARNDGYVVDYGVVFEADGYGDIRGPISWPLCRVDDYQDFKAALECGESVDGFKAEARRHRDQVIRGLAC